MESALKLWPQLKVGAEIGTKFSRVYYEKLWRVDASSVVMRSYISAKITHSFNLNKINESVRMCDPSGAVGIYPGRGYLRPPPNFKIGKKEEESCPLLLTSHSHENDIERLWKGWFYDAEKIMMQCYFIFVFSIFLSVSFFGLFLHIIFDLRINKVNDGKFMIFEWLSSDA